jgi:hypothetical protein
MEVSGHLHTPAALPPRKEPLLPIEILLTKKKNYRFRKHTSSLPYHVFESSLVSVRHKSMHGLVCETIDRVYKGICMGLEWVWRFSRMSFRLFISWLQTDIA